MGVDVGAKTASVEEVWGSGGGWGRGWVREPSLLQSVAGLRQRDVGDCWQRPLCACTACCVHLTHHTTTARGIIVYRRARALAWASFVCAARPCFSS